MRWVTLEELYALVDEGSFITYPKSFLAFLFDMRIHSDSPPNKKSAGAFAPALFCADGSGFGLHGLADVSSMISAKAPST